MSKIVNIFLFIFVLGAQKNHLIEMVLLRSTTYLLVEFERHLAKCLSNSPFKMHKKNHFLGFTSKFR